MIVSVMQSKHEEKTLSMNEEEDVKALSTHDKLFSEVVDGGVLWDRDGQGAFLRVVDGRARAALFTGLQTLSLLR